MVNNLRPSTFTVQLLLSAMQHMRVIHSSSVLHEYIVFSSLGIRLLNIQRIVKTETNFDNPPRLLLTSLVKLLTTSLDLIKVAKEDHV